MACIGYYVQATPKGSQPIAIIKHPCPLLHCSTQGMNVLLMIANYNETRHGGSYVCRTNNAAGADAASVAISSGE